MFAIVDAFMQGWKSAGHSSRTEVIREDKDVREHLSDRQLDKTLEDTFPASDPSAYY
jgi:hypothetical protein